MPDDALSKHEIDRQIDDFLAKSQALNGQLVWERQPWNTVATQDAIRHYAYGTADTHPLYVDPDYAARTAQGGLVAPPTFVISVLYPMLHGAPMKGPFASLVGGVGFEWHRRIRVGDRLRPEPRQKDCFEKLGTGPSGRRDRRLVFVIAEVNYFNQDDELVATATSPCIMAEQQGTTLQFDRPVHRYSEDEIAALEAAYKAERRLEGVRYWNDVSIGDELPPIVRGPLTMGDLVNWNAAIGPSYKSSQLAYLDLLKTPHLSVRNPATNFPTKSSQQHEDGNLAAGRGMPGPFDHGVMRFAMVAPLVTNWAGDEGFLKRLYTKVGRPSIYGDTQTYRGRVTAKHNDGRVDIAISGTNQIGEDSTSGEATVILPKR
ncbi:MAG: MaoC family dehydratase N-terminal domain-containing protein [Acetobacterales bacterium]